VLETLLKKDRAILIGSMIGITIISWLYIIYLYKKMDPMDMDAFLFAMPMTGDWSLTDFLLLFLMWFIMMVAMMTASVAPLILLFAMVNRQKQQQNPFVPTVYLLAGYFAIWAMFSLGATVLQWALQQAAWLNPDMKITYRTLGGVILLIAGLFQFSPFKQQCLYYCQSPIDFIHKKWKNGKKGAFQMGMANGLYCLGCCWILMVVLFVAGIMNLLWIALIGLFVLVEKLVRKGRLISYAAGAVLVLYGLYTLFL
jgi:predicted metal-binding membrane protein